MISCAKLPAKTCSKILVSSRICVTFVVQMSILTAQGFQMMIIFYVFALYFFSIMGQLNDLIHSFKVIEANLVVFQHST